MPEDKDALKDREETCAGCGASIWVPDPMNGVGPGRRPAAPLTLGASVEVWVCGKDDLANDYVPLATCKRKAREKRALCPGCDDTGIEPGDLCGKCARMIEVGRTTVMAEPLSTFHLRPFNFVGGAFGETSHATRQSGSASSSCSRGPSPGGAPSSAPTPTGRTTRGPR